MNKKLTPEQLWKMCEEYHEDNCEYFNGDRWVNLDCAVLVLNKALTAHTTEDDDYMVWAISAENQITLQKIEEYVKYVLEDADDKCPVAREFKAIFHGCIDWLQQEDK